MCELSKVFTQWHIRSGCSGTLRGVGSSNWIHLTRISDFLFAGAHTYNRVYMKRIVNFRPQSTTQSRLASQVIFDPATYYGDREVDLGMTHVFGGFPPAFYRG